MRISDWSSDVCSSDLRVYGAFDKMREQIDRMTSQAEFGVDGEHREVLETYKMFAYDEGWSRRIKEAIDSGLTAEAAIERVRSEEHTSELQSLMRISYAVFCLKKKNHLNYDNKY